MRVDGVLNLNLVSTHQYYACVISKDMWRERLRQVIVVSRTLFKWGWIPLLLYLGEQERGRVGVGWDRVIQLVKCKMQVSREAELTPGSHRRPCSSRSPVSVCSSVVYNLQLMGALCWHGDGGAPLIRHCNELLVVCML